MNPRDGAPVPVEVLPEIIIMGVSVYELVWSQHWHHNNDRVEFMSLSQGALTLDFNESRVQLTPGNMAFIPIGVQHRDLFDPTDEPEVFTIHFRWLAASLFFEQVTQESLSSLSEHQNAELNRLVSRLRNHSISDTPLDRTLARAVLHVLLLQIWTFVRDNQAPPEPASSSENRPQKLVERARRYIDTHYNEPLSLDRMSRYLRASPYYLSHVFTQESGFSVTAYLTSVRMEKAWNLLREQAGNVSETAHAVGYENSGYFSRQFKRHFGVAPSEIDLADAPRRR